MCISRMPVDESRRANIYDLMCRLSSDLYDINQEALRISTDAAVAETESDLMAAVKDLLSVNLHLIDSIEYISKFLEDYVYDCYT